MLVLAVDTATPAVTAGVVEVVDGQVTVLGERVTVDAKAHGELLTPHVLDALASAGRTLPEVDALVCGVGPGPFTGLRAGMVTAAALGHALDRPIYPVCSLDAIAAEVNGPVLVVTDARRREVYWAAYDGGRVTDPAVNPPAELAALLDDLGVGQAAGYGARLYESVLGLPVIAPEHPSPFGLVTAALPDLLARAEPAALTPL
ncbi:MAG: tRNA (adenosine(37)-N6)-threonylcarbamoyltransferase complex dimerization subunit type 1 TsaB, partial [Actinomycetota bacterium]|nr:tRNA (adenosine(37)-N6)-threonylcarbamoyltransferase complex dimerization subunit type 1 TsaB [Actinomycetota bacterium]